MKSILLTSTALVAFAGAAAAEVNFSGEASAEYNTITGYTTSAEMTATLTQQLDNGLTAEASITFDPVASELSYGSISLSSDNASLTFGTGLDGAVQSSVGDDYGIGQVAEEELDGIVGTYSMGDTTLFVSMGISEGEVESDALEFGVTTSAGSWELAFGATQAGEFAATAAGTVGGADLNFGYASNDEWDAGIAYTFGSVTVSASTDEAEAWTVGAEYDGGVYNAGFEYNADESWEVTAGYDANGIVVDAAYTDLEVLTIGATYTMESLTVGAGMITAPAADTTTFAFADYDLGNGASAFINYADAAADLEEVGPSERDIAVGTTVGVSFTF